MNDGSLQMLEYDGMRRLLVPLARTDPGKARCRALHPLRDRESLERELAALREFVQLQEKGLGWSLAPLEDPGDWFSILRISGTTLEPASLLGLSGLCRQALEARRAIGSRREDCPTLWGLVEPLPTSLGEIAQRITSALLPSGEVDERASPELRRLARAMEGLRRELRQMLERVIARSGEAIQEELVTVRNERYVIPVKSDHRGRIRGVAHATSASGATLFMEPLEAIEPNNQLQRLLGDRKREIARILLDLTEGLRRQLPACRLAASVIAELDLVAAKAAFLQKYDCVLPLISRNHSLELTGARHPLLEEHLRSSGQAVVPISLRLDEDCRVMVISGANAGGKTVVLKTAGLLSLMGLSGLPVPAVSACIPLYASVLADIGDGQSIASDLSTFTSHVSNVARMMEECRPPALILLDEVGTGTDPEEGSALGVAVVDHFRQLGAHVITSTHYRGLKMYATSQEGVQNASVAFDETTLQPTYRLVEGQAGISAGIEMAGRFGLPSAVIRRAAAEVEGSTREMNRYLQRIRIESDRAEAIREALTEERRVVAEKYQRLDAEAARREEERRQRFEGELRSAIEGFLEQASSLLQEIRDQSLRRAVEARVKARARKVEGEAGPRARAATIEQARSLESNQPLPAAEAPAGRPGDPRIIRDRPIRVGDPVRVKGLGKTGRVEKILGSSAEIRLGSMRLRQALSGLELVEIPEPEGGGAARAAAGHDLVRRPGDGPVEAELKLIGKTVREAVEELDRYLDRAFLDGQLRLRVVHGHGTGTLRQAVRDHLQEHPQVAGFGGAPREEGGEGATIVELES